MKLGVILTETIRHLRRGGRLARQQAKGAQAQGAIEPLLFSKSGTQSRVKSSARVEFRLLVTDATRLLEGHCRAELDYASY